MKSGSWETIGLEASTGRKTNPFYFFFFLLFQVVDAFAFANLDDSVTLIKETTCLCHSTSDACDAHVKREESCSH